MHKKSTLDYYTSKKQDSANRRQSPAFSSTSDLTFADVTTMVVKILISGPLTFILSKVGVGSILGHFAFCRLGCAYAKLCWVSLHSTQPTFFRCLCEMRNPTTADFGTESQKFFSIWLAVFFGQRRRSYETPVWNSEPQNVEGRYRSPRRRR